MQMNNGAKCHHWLHPPWQATMSLHLHRGKQWLPVTMSHAANYPVCDTILIPTMYALHTMQPVARCPTLFCNDIAFEITACYGHRGSQINELAQILILITSYHVVENFENIKAPFSHIRQQHLCLCQPPHQAATFEQLPFLPNCGIVEDQDRSHSHQQLIDVQWRAFAPRRRPGMILN